MRGWTEPFFLIFGCHGPALVGMREKGRAREGKRPPARTAPWKKKWHHVKHDKAKSAFGKEKHERQGSRARTPQGGPLRDLLLAALPDGVQLQAVQTCLEHVQILARQLLGEDSAVVVQGSYAQGLALRGSDLDIAVIRSRKRQKEEADAVDRKEALQCLQRLAQALSDAKLEEIRIALRIFSAKVPVLRLHCGAKGERNVVVDVSVGGSLLRGACDRAIYHVLQRDRMAPALCRLVKLWAKRRKLTNTLKGGLSSFSFVLLTVFFLQQRAHHGHRSLPSQASVTGSKAKPANPENCCPPPLGLQVPSEEDLVQLLMGFFTWAAEELPKLQNWRISIASADAEPRAGPYKPLVLEVPFSPDENAARCLRIDVWEGVICQELHRANRLTKQLREPGREAQASIIRSLFSNEEALEPPQNQDPPSPEQEHRPPGERPPVRRKRRRTPVPTKTQSLENEKIMPEIVARVDRWLGLRSLLDPRWDHTGELFWSACFTQNSSKRPEWMQYPGFVSV